jgi:hypothetical protein
LTDDDRKQIGIKYTVHFTDVTDKDWTASYTTTGIQTDSPHYLPGTEQRFRPKLSPN